MPRAQTHLFLVGAVVAGQTAALVIAVLRVRKALAVTVTDFVLEEGTVREYHNAWE